jgi:hypothetical protein
VKEVVAILAGNLEAHVADAFARENGLLTLAADSVRPEFHSSTPKLYVLSVLGELASQRFLILRGSLRCYAAREMCSPTLPVIWILTSASARTNFIPI